MIEAIKSLLNLPAAGEDQQDEAARLEKQAAEQEAAAAGVTRAETLLDGAQERHQRGDRIGASIYLSEAITLLRTAHALHPESVSLTLAHALRHAAHVRSELREYAVAGSHIQEAIRLYRSLGPEHAIELANALRVSALNNEHEAITLWAEAEQLYTAANLNDGLEEARKHLQSLQQIAPEVRP